MMCDGYLPENGAASYRQLNPVSKPRFLDKLDSVFDDFEVPSKSYENGKVQISSVIACVLKSYDRDVKFGTFSCRIPERLINGPKEHKIAALSAFIVDDGTISSDRIRLSSANKKFLEGWHKLVNSMYTSLPIKQDSQMFYFDIKASEARKFHSDLMRLIRKHPLCDLAHKQEKLVQLTFRPCR